VVSPDDAIAAGRRIAGLIGHSPGPGIYSRMQRAVEAMPEMVRAEELPGLIRRHKEGVPGWELKAVDLPSLYEGRASVPREELLRAVEERSPLYTHGEVVQRGGPDDYPKSQADIEFPEFAGLFGPEPFDSRIGQGLPSGKTEYDQYSQGGDDYTEILLTQPGARHWVYGNHWDIADAVAHARFDRHGDALRINELQSDLGIHNRKAREEIRNAPGNSGRLQLRDFPLEDAWLDLLIKRLALETARGGYRAIEIASPASIADMVGGNIDNYEHLYEKVIPGRLERLGRKMGGLTRDLPSSAERFATPEDPYGAFFDSIRDLRSNAVPDWARQNNIDRARRAFNDLASEYADYNRYGTADLQGAAELLHSRLRDLARQHGDYRGIMDSRMPALMRAAEDLSVPPAEPQADIPIRYLMSDEMRRNIIRNGIPASVLGAAALSNERQP